MGGTGMTAHVPTKPPEARSTGSEAAPTAAEVVGDGGSFRATVLGRLGRARSWIILGVLLGTAVLLGALAAGSGEREPLSPENPAPEGARAAAEVLGRSGVEVVRAESFDDAVGALQGPDDTLLLHDPNTWLSAEQLAALGGGLADRTVLVEPGLPALTELADGVRSAGVVPAEPDGPLEADCASPDARAAAEVSAGGFSYRGQGTCFPLPQDDGADPAGIFVTTPDETVAVLGHGAIMSNGLIDEHGNAALTLRVLGSTPTLVWYQPTAEDLAVTSGPVDPRSLLPGFVNPLMFWLLVTALIAILWRGRRLGPLVTEPLPVLVRSSETAAGRARLYQDAGAVAHAAETLRAATLNRLAAAVRIPPGSARSSVVEAAARRTAREFTDLDRLLNSYIPSSDAQLVQWSQELEKLEQEILRP
ncbi:protein of unknown function [Arthrobacter subterraneus]|uniref:DUF4350 domain-containing protein n=1 Tax=Arthrobacter subterraneus TaxID=335973 RepID=A0A1G8BSU6_9MICC|nr:DUF4350 domain-containing protein [Arthrobacter subterraneus]SDH36346.1 protein of unknown function [Arthrobacter subterraneus]